MVSCPHHTVRIDGEETVLTFDAHSGSRGYQYLAPGNAASHAFDRPLVKGEVFTTNGHRYEVLT